MVNFTGVMKIHGRYLNTQAITTWEQRGRLNLDDGYVHLKYNAGGDKQGIYDIVGYSAEEVKDKFLEAERTGFSTIRTGFSTIA